MADLLAIARRALSLLDLTDLSEDCDEASIDRLCARAETPHGPVAALCIYPKWLPLARAKRPSHRIKLATVANFPGGDQPLSAIVHELVWSLEAGADEIDVVLPWRALLAGDEETPAEFMTTCRRCVPGDRLLKIILETGELGSPAMIARAARIALAGGADFLKTSTGKVKLNATPAAARIMLEEIKQSARTAGFKAEGGIRTTADAAIYLAEADRIMGRDWASPHTFRFGASALLDDLLSILDGTRQRPAV
jgi:deoxyribose-phosphate aldolase